VRPLPNRPLMPPPARSPACSAGNLQRSGTRAPDFLQHGKLYTAAGLKLVLPLTTATLSGGNVLNFLSWPSILAAMSVSYLGGLASKHLMADLHRTGMPSSVSANILKNLTEKDFSGLLLDSETYAELGRNTQGQYRSKYEYFLKQTNQLAGHCLGLFSVHPQLRQRFLNEGKAPLFPTRESIQKEALAAYQKIIQSQKKQDPSTASQALLQVFYQKEAHRSWVAKGLDALTHWQAVRWGTTTPLMAIIPHVEEHEGNLDQVYSWISNIPVFGALLDAKAKSLSRARQLYFKTDLRKDKQSLRLLYGSDFKKKIQKSNQWIQASNEKNQTTLPLLSLNDATFKQYLVLRSRHEKQAAVRLAFYKALFNLFPHKDIGLLLKAWHDVDGSVSRTCFDIAQNQNLKKGFVLGAYNLFNETYAILMNGGFSTLLQFGIAQVPAPFNGFARFMGDAFMLAFDIQLTPVIKAKYGYHGFDKTPKP
jgi:hypothetical protein